MHELEPLTCTACRAPVPLGDGAEVTCPSCDGRQPLPAAYQEFRTSRQLSTEDAARLDDVCKDIARPPALWQRVAVVVGFGVGIVTLVVLAIGALVGAIAGLIVVAKAEAEGAIAMIMIGICVVVCGLVSVPLVGEVLAFMVVHGDFKLASDVALGEATQLEADLWVGGVLYAFSIVPIALAYRTKQNLTSLEAVRAHLAAQPALKGGVMGCRACGAPLTVKEGAVAARCLYCQAESLVRVSGADAARQKATTFAVRSSIEETLASRAAIAAKDRKQMWLLLVGGPFIAPIVCLGGLVLHALAS